MPGPGTAEARESTAALCGAATRIHGGFRVAAGSRLSVGGCVADPLALLAIDIHRDFSADGFQCSYGPDFLSAGCVDGIGKAANEVPSFQMMPPRLQWRSFPSAVSLVQPPVSQVASTASKTPRR